ncbi:MAG TPA: CarD family transcriptional regulator, partial [Treponemataceae bacterium]|nr:CarD family transcriptional regulator [Treponemataceae bacterium]
MKKIVIASTDPKIIAIAKKTIALYSAYFDADFPSDTEEVISYIDYELPEIKVIDFRSNKIDGERIMNEIDRDLWLHYGGVIAIVANKKEKKELEDRKNPNFLLIQTPD